MCSDIIQDTLLAQVNMVKYNYREIRYGRYSTTFGSRGTYVLEFTFRFIDDEDIAIYTIYKDNEIIYNIEYEIFEANYLILEYIEDNI